MNNESINLLHLIEEKFVNYCNLYDNLISKIIDDGGYMPLMQHPLLIDYILSVNNFTKNYKKNFFSIRTKKNEVVALFHFCSNNKIEEVNLDHIPLTIIENYEIINEISHSQYKKILGNIIFNKKEILIRDYINFGKISLLSTLFNIKECDIKVNFTRVIKIDQNEEILRKNIRKSYRNLINQSNKKLKINILSNNIIESDIYRLSDFHEKVVGRKTRSIYSWQEQLKLVQNDKGFFVEAFEDDNLIGFSFFLCFGKILFYGSSACINDNYHSSHAIIWHAIQLAKKRGTKIFDIGQQVYQEDQNEPNLEKLKSISLFKRGFGGFDQVYLDFRLKD